MIKTLFYIRFRGQLRRAQPELVSSVEDTVSAAVLAAGGSTETGRKVLGASFNEDRIGFWLDIVIFLEKVHKALSAGADALNGYAFTLGPENPEISTERLCRFLSGRNRGESTGIWCSPEAREALEPYMVFCPAARTEDEGLYEGYRELKEWKSFGAGLPEYPYREKIAGLLARESGKNTLLFGPGFTGKRDGVYHYCAALPGGIPPLRVRFGAGSVNRAGGGEPGRKARGFPGGGHSFVCFADAFTPGIRSFISGAFPGGDSSAPDTDTGGEPRSPGAPAADTGNALEKLDAEAAALFKERLRDEWSPATVERGRRFIKSLLTIYTAAARMRKSRGTLILEDPSLADSPGAEIFREVYSSLEDREELPVLAADNAPEEELENWSAFFQQTLKFDPEDFPDQKNFDIPRGQKMPVDLWELSYNIFLLGRYFPDCLFPRLFEEEGLNRELYFRALNMLADMGLIEDGEPRFRLPNFGLRAEKALGERKKKVRLAVRNRILAWTASGSLSPCFNLLRILSDLGDRAGDALVLRSLKADTLNGTWEGIEEALKKGRFASLVGAGNVPVLSYIYKTLKVLVWGDREEIQRVFEMSVPPLSLEDGSPCFEAFRAQVYTNLASYHIGGGNFDAASEILRKAMLLNRALGENTVPAYRLFSLVHFARQRIDDALEYIGFALDQAEKAGQPEELALVCYFASSINFVYGNLSRAERFAERAEKTAEALGQPGWAARARFLRGRILFETGRYAVALEIFKSVDPGPDQSPGNAAGDTALPQKAKMAGTVRAWIYRTEFFLGRPLVQNEDAVSTGLDGKLFEIEAAYFSAGYEKALALAEAFPASPEEPAAGAGGNFLFTEQPDWASGFAQAENVFKPEKIPGTKPARIYRAMARCALSAARLSAAPGFLPEAEPLDDMQRFIRDEILSGADPHDIFYFHAWYCMLRDSGAAQVDMHTALSMAYKRLQRRAGRIDDAGTKQDFLTLPRRNNTLSLAAREYKLI